MKRKNKPVLENFMKGIMTTVIVFFVGLFAISATVIAILSFLWVNPNFNCFGTLLPNYRNIERTTHLIFPESTENLTFEKNLKNRGCTVWVQFEMSSEDFEAFQESTLIEEFDIVDLDDYGSGFDYYMEQMNWSQPENSLAGYVSDWSNNPYPEQWIFIDISDPNRWVVYIIDDRDWV